MNATLHDYQEQVKSFMAQNPHCGIFLDVGMGKTLITLSLLDDLYKSGQLNHHVLVIAPKNIARTTWIDEIKKWGFSMPYQSLIINDKEKQLSKKKREERYIESLSAPPTMYFINRDLIASMVDFFIDRNVGRNGQYKFPQGWRFGTIIVDEYQSFKSYNSERFLALKYLEQHGLIHSLIGLTGTPTPKGLEDLWAEMFLLDRGARLGPNITAYRRTYFREGIIVNGYPVTYIPHPWAEGAIYDKIKDIVISMKNTHLNLPECTFNKLYVHMTPDEMELYKTMMKTQVLHLDEDTTVKACSAGVLSSKLSQMASGALYLPKDETEPQPKNGVPEYAIIHNHKVEQLEYIVNNTDSPVLVAYHFKSDKDMILKYFAKQKDTKPIVEFDGTPKMVHDWNARKIPAMLLQPASAGFGLNLQEGGHTLVWYTIPWSLEEYIQTNGRIHRQGQTEPVIIHLLMTEHTIDNRILRNVLEKDAAENRLLDAVDISGITIEPDASVSDGILRSVQEELEAYLE